MRRRNTEGEATDAEVAARLQALETLDHRALREAWQKHYRADAPQRLSRDVLALGVAWTIQEQAFGGHGASVRRRLAELAGTLERDGDIAPARVARLKPGATLIREWGGVTHSVYVADDGFTWNGKRWRSLSVIARQITGARWSGPRFFGLKERPADTDGVSTDA
jgi:DUF2924 family protein